MKTSSLAMAFFLAASLARATLAQDAQTAKTAGASEPAQSAKAAKSASTDATNTNNPVPVRVRASHRVEVIAPGEHVETIIDRMRASTAAASSTDKPADPSTSSERLQVRPPDSQRTGDRGAANQQRNGSHGNGPGGPPSGPANSNNGPPPERR